MKPGNKLYFLFYFLFFNFISCFAEDKIISSPLINLEKIKPSFEEIEVSNNDKNFRNEIIKDKKKVSEKDKKPSAKLIGLDKITSKNFEIIVNLGETKKVGLLEIKVLKCGKIKSENKNDNVAYLQVKDLTSNNNDDVFVFNGWMFSSSPSIAPFDHPVYDIWLIGCN